MTASATPMSLDVILPWRAAHVAEMNCQVTKDSIHDRPGWTIEYLLRLDEVPVGYGSVAVLGPWKDRPTIYQMYVEPPHRGRVFDLFEALAEASGAVAVETQSNDPILTVMLHTYCRDVAPEAIVFQDRLTTALPPPDGAAFRRKTQEHTEWALDVAGETVATGGLLWHYNRPYGDIYMEVAEAHRRRGYGAYLVQEIKRACYELGGIPACRCNVNNVASRKTLQKAGFVPCGNILAGTLPPPGASEKPTP